MAITKVAVWNRALAIIGGSKKGMVISENDESEQAKWLRMFWEDAVDYVVTLRNWYEALTYVVLAETGDTIEKAEWDVAYTRPPDCLRIIRFTDICDQTKNYPYAELRNYILSNETTGYLYYVRNMDYDDVTQMSTGMRSVIAARLAFEVAGVFKPKMQPVAERAYETALIRAEEMNAESVFQKDGDTPLAEII